MSIASLARRADRLTERLAPIHPRETWRLVLEEGQELPAHIRLEMGPYDSVVIRQVPRGFLGLLLGEENAV